MRVTYIMNTIDRFDITPRVTLLNKTRAGRLINEFIITDNGSADQRIIRWGGMNAHKFIKNETNIGNPQALNNALDLATGDYIVIAGNDIELTQNWLTEAIKVMEADKDVCVVGFGHDKGERSNIAGVDVVKHQVGTTGTVVLRKSNLKQLGYFATFSKYGYWDGDYCTRLRAAKLKDYFLPNVKMTHHGHDLGESTEYRKMKDAEAKKARPHIVKLAAQYGPSSHYLTRDNVVLNKDGKPARKKRK